MAGCSRHVFDLPVSACPRQQLGRLGPRQFGRRRMAERGERLRQHGAPPALRQGGRQGLLGQLLPGGVGDERHMGVDRRRQAEQGLQINLARGVPQQVGAAHDVGDALERVVHHHRQLVGEQAVGALDDEVADLMRQVLLQVAVDAVVKVGAHIRHAHAPGTCDRTGRQAVAAGAGVEDLAFVVARRLRELAAGAGAGIDRALACNASSAAA